LRAAAERLFRTPERRHKMLATERREDVVPVCPHCSESLRTVWYQELAGILGKRYLYFCPACRKVLGVTHRKGFWMG